MKCTTLLVLAMVAMLSASGPQTRPAEPRGRVIGIGGVFFESDHPRELHAWYAKHLGFRQTPMGVTFLWNGPGTNGKQYRTAWAIFPRNARYFQPTKSPLMINYIVDDLDAILTRLKSEGVTIDPKRYKDEAGRFAWIFDSDGNKIELWQPGTPPGGR